MLCMKEYVVLEIHISDGVDELCGKCFLSCQSLAHVTFGENPSLELIGKKAFSRSGVHEIHIPGSVEKLCEECFYRCESLSRVTLSESSSLKLIGEKVFIEAGFSEVLLY